MNNISLSQLTTRIMSASSPSHQRGVVLVLSLVILMAMTLIGITAMQSTSQEERMAKNVQQRNLAFQAAEYGLRAGEKVLEAKVKVLEDAHATDVDTPEWSHSEVDSRTYWTNYDWAAAQEADLDNTTNHLAEKPRYVIEKKEFTESVIGTGNTQSRRGSIKFDKKGASNSLTLATVTNYRITSRGVGGVTDAVVILQTTFSY